MLQDPWAASRAAKQGGEVSLLCGQLIMLVALGRPLLTKRLGGGLRLLKCPLPAAGSHAPVTILSASRGYCSKAAHF